MQLLWQQPGTAALPISAHSSQSLQALLQDDEEDYERNRNQLSLAIYIYSFFIVSFLARADLREGGRESFLFPGLISNSISE